MDIKVKIKDLYEYIEKLKKYDEIKAVEVSIFEYENDDGETNKYLTIDILECGGLCLIANDESIKEMSQEEILDIP